jgi:20S proteasome alpha/beta subunit
MSLNAPPLRRNSKPWRRTTPLTGWGFGMTVCVGAICRGGIVTASDRLLTWGYSASETALKAARIAPRWMTMMAGDDISMVDDVIRNTRETLAVIGDDPTISQVQAALFGAWRDAQNKLAEAKVLNAYRLTVPQFLNVGRQKFGESHFVTLANEIAVASTLGCQLLVAGFNGKDVPNLFVTEDGALRDRTRADCAAIGSGHTAALASLSVDSYTRECGWARAVYSVCAAKFMAEASRAPGIGKTTIVLCMLPSGRTKWIFKRQIEIIRKLWEEQGRPRVPPEKLVVETIGQILKQQDWTDA